MVIGIIGHNWKLTRFIIMNYFRQNLKYIVYLIPILLLMYLLWQNTKPVLEINYNVKGKTPLVSEIVPLSRVSGLKKDSIGYYRSINKEPAYLDIRTPRKYHTIETEITYSDLNTDIFEIGVARDETRKSFDFVTLENKILDNLKWNKIDKGGLVLYQRKPLYKSIDDFVARPPKFDETLVYRANLDPKLKNFGARGKTVIDFPVKEKIKFAFYHDGGKINFNLKGFSVGLFQNGKPLPFPASDDFEEGIYIMEIKGNKGSVLDGFTIGSSYVAILDNIKIGKLKRPKNIYLAGSRFLARTESASGVQKLLVGGKTLDIEKSFFQYKKVFNNRSLKTIRLSKGNIELDGAIFFIKPYNLFYPRYEHLYNKVDLSNVNFVLAKYTPPKKGLSVKSTQSTFDITNTLTPYNTLRILLSLPNSSDCDCDDEGLVKIRDVKIRLFRERLSIEEILGKIKFQLQHFMELRKEKNEL